MDDLDALRVMEPDDLKEELDGRYTREELLDLAEQHDVEDITTNMNKGPMLDLFVDRIKTQRLVDDEEEAADTDDTPTPDEGEDTKDDPSSTDGDQDTEAESSSPPEDDKPDAEDAEAEQEADDEDEEMVYAKMRGSSQTVRDYVETHTERDPDPAKVYKREIPQSDYERLKEEDAVAVDEIIT
jgi:hypothetical protein